MKKIGFVAIIVFCMFLQMISVPKSANAAAAASIDVSVVLHIGDLINLSAGYPSVIWTVTELNGNATDKAAVTSTGVVTALKPGKIKVIAAASDGTNYRGEILITILGEEEKPSAVLNGTVSVSAGESFDLIYGLSHVAGGIYAQDVTLTYDPAKLEFDSAVSLKDNAVVVVDISKQPGKVRILLATLGEEHANAAYGDLIKLHWKVKPTVQPGPVEILLQHVIVSNGSGVETQLNTKNHSQVVVKAASVNKQLLLDLIAQAQEKINNGVEGTLPGQYKKGAKAVLQGAIDAAKAVADNASSSQQGVDDALSALRAALQAFADSIIPSMPGDQNGDGKVSIGDIAVIAAAYGKSNKDPDWDQYKNCDINGDGIIDVADLAAVARILLDEK
ncbi:cohesin domain-containing protein [Paenibacillus sp. N3.4]|uniref:cohesin domain-containing protein n=1 Tax=Paenibacillus sp. N3.4 TaxID=2603222 RepID=UPI00164FA963|nr:cohesin domain-containing protein [Paenibacillus sp. N3.4]